MSDEPWIDAQKNVWLILNQCKKGAELYTYSRQTFIPAFPVSRMDFAKDAQVEGIDQLKYYELSNEQVKLLRALYQAQDETGRQVVVELCSKLLVASDCSAQAFAFLVRYHTFENALKLVIAKQDSDFLRIASTTLPALAQILRFDHSFISNDHLEALCPELRKALASHQPKGTVEKKTYNTTIRYSVEESKQFERVKPVEELINYVCRQASRILYLRLKKQLDESVNFEINQDRDKLLDSLKSLGFSERLTEFLKFAEGEFAKAQDIFSYKACIDQVRSFFAELLTETAEKIAGIRGETLAKAGVDTKRPAEVRQYLQRTGFFSEQFRTLVDGLYKFMSDEGTHTLGSTRDVARIARNIAIEIGLLITKRLQQPKTVPTV